LTLLAVTFHSGPEGGKEKREKEEKKKKLGSTMIV